MLTRLPAQNHTTVGQIENSSDSIRVFFFYICVHGIMFTEGVSAVGSIIFPVVGSVKRGFAEGLDKLS